MRCTNSPTVLIWAQWRQLRDAREIQRLDGQVEVRRAGALLLHLAQLETDAFAHVGEEAHESRRVLAAEETASAGSRAPLVSTSRISLS